MYFVKRSFSILLAATCLFSSNYNQVNSQVVCSEDELIRELYEDIIDNGKLDCLRKSAPIPGETDDDAKRRIAANWDSDCSFEAEGTGNANWLPKFINNYGLEKRLVDVNGKSVEIDFEDQADMCEIVRALVANGKIPEIGASLDNISLKLLDHIKCVGNEGSTKVCAATGSSFANKKSWLIFLDALSIKIDNYPTYQQIGVSK